MGCVTVVVAAAVFALAWRAQTPQVPSWAVWEDRSLAADLDGDGSFETLTLQGRRLSVAAETGAVCQSDDAWLVSDVLVGDVDRCGDLEVVLVAWRRGSYGEHRPFWVAHDSGAYSQHVFVLRYEAGRLVPLWMSSALGIEVVGSWMDGAARITLSDRDGHVTLWEWGAWGLELVNEAEGLADMGIVPVAEGDASPLFTLVATGDCIAHEGILAAGRVGAGSPGYDFAGIFAPVTPWVSSFDLALVTQETPLVSREADVACYPLFGTPRELGDALVGAGFDVVASATNHALDRGIAGVDETLAFWRERHPEVAVLGIHAQGEQPFQPMFVERKGFRLSIFDATYGLNGQELPEGEAGRVDLIAQGDALERAVRAAEGSCDLTVCMLHVGEENAQEPGDEQRALEERLVDAGADVVFCSHAHVVQGVTHVTTASGTQGVVFHGLGNLVAAQADPRCVLGGAACVTVGRDGEGTARVEAYALEGTVSHVGGSVAQVCLLDAYDETLAATHGLNAHEADAVTAHGLRDELFRAQSGIARLPVDS